MDKIPGYSANASWAYSYGNSPSATGSSSNIRATASGSQCLGLSEQISELRGAIEMSPEQLTDCLQKCREQGFSNCDMQALEVGLHLRYGLGLTDFSIVSNHKLSHNYVVFPANDTFPKGAIVDSWTGQGVVELNMKNKLKFMHHEGNYHVNENMHNWIENDGSQYVLS